MQMACRHKNKIWKLQRDLPLVLNKIFHISFQSFLNDKTYFSQDLIDYAQ